jgi:hypothetical protein
MPGNVMSYEYFARPDAFARPSTRSRSVPTVANFVFASHGGASPSAGFTVRFSRRSSFSPGSAW